MYLNFNYFAFAVANFNPYHMKFFYTVPDAYDWIDRGAVAPVSDKGAYRSSSIFTTLDNSQSLYFINKGIVILSQLMTID